MSAPFFKFGMFGDEVSLIVAFVIGIGFGFFLERAGFGKAPKLAAQFYFKELSVLKVMFTAIITAMTGLYVLSRLGFVDLSLVYLTPTFVLPQVVGGLVLGVGFVIGGYCPGTSVVSAATGRFDGMAYLVGLMAGLVGFAEVYPHVEKLLHVTSMGQITLAQLFDVPYGLLVFAVVLMALGAFAGGEWAEKKFGGKQPDPNGSLTGQPFKLTPVRALALGLAVLGIGAAFGGNPYRGSRVSIDTKALALTVAKGADLVSVEQLADWLVQDRNDYQLLDLRSEKEYAAYHIPTAQNMPFASLSPDLTRHNEKLIVYSEGDNHAAEAWFLLHAQGFNSVYILEGGLERWKDTILFPRKPRESTPESLSSFEKRVQLARHFGGAPQGDAGDQPAVSTPAVPKLTLPVIPSSPETPGAKPQPKKKKEGC